MNDPVPSNAGFHTPIRTNLPVLKVIGLGGGGQNAVDRMIELGLTGIEFIAANSDAQVLKNSLAPVKIQLGPKITRGLGAGGDPTIGEQAAEESFDDLKNALSGADMVFLTCGMGGGTGTGSIPVAANIAREEGAVVVAIVSMPFSFEIGRRQANARAGLTKLHQYTDTLITVPNDRLLQIAPKDLPIEMAFRLADDILRQGIQGISELVTQPGLINVDFSHVKTMMKNGGGSLLAIGTGQGENRVSDAMERALHHPMLDSINLENATGIIANFTGGEDLAFTEVVGALNSLQARCGGLADIIPGVISDPKMEDRVQVILVLTGLGATSLDEKPAKVEKQVQATTEEKIEIPREDFPFLMNDPLPKDRPDTTDPQNDIDIPAFIRRKQR